MKSPVKPKVVLVGAGHAHLYTIKRLRQFTERNISVTVISSDKFWYSGLATGMLGGIYPPELDQVDVGAMVRLGGGAFVSGALQSIDHTKREIVLEDGTRLPFDILSINIGSACKRITGENEYCYAAKPIRRLFELRRVLECEFSHSEGKPLDVAVAGGGVTAFEIAGNVRALAERYRRKCSVTILCRSKRPLAELPTGATTRILKNFADRGIQVITDSSVLGIEGRTVRLGDSRYFNFDFFVNATGLIANTMARDLQVPMDSSGGILVDDTLRSPSRPNIFAAGDCASFGSKPLPKIGVFAIRQSPVLFNNICALLVGSPLHRFVPQQHFLSIVTLGDGNALATRGWLWWYGRWAFILKDRIDRRFLKSISSN